MELTPLGYFLKVQCWVVWIGGRIEVREGDGVLQPVHLLVSVKPE